MAIYNGRILMRKGNEADFDASKLYAGEWAVSLDAGIVRICLEAGKVIRMATYEAFEEDMKQIEAILLECQTIEEAVQRINTEINANVDAVVEYVGQAKTYRDEAKTYRDEAEAFKNQAGEIADIDIATTEKAGIVKPDGETIRVDEDGTIRADAGTVDYTELENKPSINGTELEGNKTLDDLGIASKTKVETLETELEKTTYKVDTVIANIDLGIKETASGEEIHLIDSAEGKAVEFALYGKARQNTTSGKNLLENTATTQSINGVTFTVNDDGTVTVNGTPTVKTSFQVCRTPNFEGTVKLTGCPKGGSTTTFCLEYSDYMSIALKDFGDGRNVEKFDYSTFPNARVDIRIEAGYTANNLVFKPMLSVEGGEYEPFTNGASPNPSYPQEIEVSGESYNLLHYPYYDSTKTENGITFTDNDGIITVNGTATADVIFVLKARASNYYEFDKGTYIVSGCPSGGSVSTYGISVNKTVNGAGLNLGSDYGNGTSIEILEENYPHSVFINIKSGTKAENLTFYPMIRKASVKNDRYMPYGKGSVEVKSVGKNLLKNAYHEDNVTNSGITYTRQSDGSLLLNGTSNATSYYRYAYGNINQEFLKKYTGKEVTMSIESTHVSADYRCEFVKNGNIILSIYPTNKKNTFVVPEYEELRVYSRIAIGNTFTNDVVKLQIELGNFATEYQPYKETLSTIPTPNGLAGIKVSSNGNYTDSNGQQWICDEIVKYADGSGEYVQRIGQLEFDDSTTFMDYNLSNGVFAFNYMQYTDFKVQSRVAMFDCLTRRNINDLKNRNIGYEKLNDGFIYINLFGRETTLSEVREYLVEHPIKMQSELATPITTPLTAEELAEISTFYPITNISNDFDCGMSVKYNCDSKNYIDKQLAEMEKAREQAMMSMFLLLPEETQATMIENDVNNLLTESEN